MKAKEELNGFVLLFKELCNESNSFLIKREYKIDFYIMIDFMISLCIDSFCSSTVFTRSYNIKNPNISSSGLLKKWKILIAMYWTHIITNLLVSNQLTNKIYQSSLWLEKFYKVNNNKFLRKYRLIACDGTYINMVCEGKCKETLKKFVQVITLVI